MAYEPDFSGDLEVVFDLATFTLKVEGESDIALSNCVLTTPVRSHEAEPTDGQVIQMDQLMVWPIARTPKPPLGSVLVDSDGTHWTILSVDRKQHVETWEAHCRNLDIIPSVSNHVTVLKAMDGRGRANEFSPTWVGLFSGQKPPTQADVLHARLQPAVEIAQIRYGAEWSRQTYRLIMNEKMDIDLARGEFRVLDAAGNHYRIVELMNECRLERYPVAMVVRIIEGREYFRQGSPSPLLPPSFPQ